MCRNGNERVFQENKNSGKGTQEGKQGLQPARSTDYTKGGIIKRREVVRERKIDSKDLEYQAKRVQTNLKQVGVAEIVEQ